VFVCTVMFLEAARTPKKGKGVYTIVRKEAEKLAVK